MPSVLFHVVESTDKPLTVTSKDVEGSPRHWKHLEVLLSQGAVQLVRTPAVTQEVVGSSPVAHKELLVDSASKSNPEFNPHRCTAILIPVGAESDPLELSISSMEFYLLIDSPARL